MESSAPTARPVADTAPPQLRKINDRATYDRYAPLVRRIAMRVVRRLPPTITIDDMLSAGWVGLAEALTRCSSQMPEEEVEAYVSHRVRGAMLDYLRSLDPMSRRMRSASRQVTTAVKTLTTRLGRAPEEEELADEMGLELKDYQSLLGEIASTDCVTLDITELSGPRSEPDAAPDMLASRRELIGRVAEAIEELPERLKLVVGLYYQEECSLREIGEVLGVTESRVCQLHGEAVHRIRAALEMKRPGVTTKKPPPKRASGGSR